MKLFKKLPVLLPVILVAALCGSTKAKEPVSPPDQFRTRLWNSNDGLPQDQVSCLEQTRDGYLWIGTWFGLARFDGTSFVVFNSLNTPAFQNNTINCLAADSAGTLWIGTTEGLVRHDRSGFSRLPLTGLANRNVTTILPSRSGAVWAGIGGNVALIENGRPLKLWPIHSQHPEFILALGESPDGSLSVITRNMWLSLRRDSERFSTNFARSASFQPWLCAVAGGMSGGPIVGNREGLWILRPGQPPEMISPERAGVTIDHVARDASGALWVNVRGHGAYRKDAQGWHKFSPTTLDRTSFLCVKMDLQGNHWIGTHNGLLESQPLLVHNFSREQGLPTKKVWSVCETTDGMTCVGTESGLAFIDPAGKLESAADDETNTQDSDRLVWPAANGGVFTARNKFGLFRFSDGALELAATFNDLSGSIDCLWGDATGELLVGTTKEVCVYNQSLPLPWGPPKKTIPVAEAFCIFKQSDGTLWFATDGLGLARMQKGVISWFTSTNGLPSDHVWSVCGDASGTLWVGTEEGLARYRSGRFFAFTREQGLRENIINSLLLEEPDFLWVSGQRGIYRFSLRDLNQVADGAASRVDPFVLSAADGMGTSETNGGKQPASWRGKDGRLWFPTMNGVVSILPRDVPVSEPPPPILIQQVKADDQIIYGDFSTNAPADSNREFTLKPGRGRVVEFTFTANSFLDAKRMRFRYRLVGGQNTWTPETTERTIHYINLRPGDYRFEVIGANEHNTWSPVPAVFQFRIEPHFWQTTAFYILCFCAAAALVLGIQAYRLRWQRRLLALEQQKALANERSRIARDLHDDLGTALTGLALELDVAGRDATKGNSVPERLHESAARTRSLAERMRQVVWTVNPKCDNVASLATFLEQQVEQFFRHDGVRLRIDFPDEIPEVYLGSEARYQLALVVREALTNVIRHANAVEVILKIELRDGHGLNGTRSGPSASEDSARLLIVTIKDNGRGFPAGNKGGNGLSNMRDRLSKIGGTCEISSTPGAGTTVSFILPVSYSHETT